MTFELLLDPAPADWIVSSAAPFDQLVFFGPAHFPGYARLRFIPDPTGRGQAEADVDLPEDHRSDTEQTRRALRVLARFTATPEDCCFCVWEGYSDVTLPAVPEGSLVTLPHRRYALFRGTLDDVDSWEDVFGGGSPVAPPAFVWPADHSWCFASDVDPHWAGIGASEAAITALVEDRELDAVVADPSVAQPGYR